MLDPSIPPMPDHIIGVRRAYARMLKQLREALAGTTVTPQQGLMIMALGNDTVIAGSIVQDGYYDGTNASYNLNALEKARLIRRSNIKGDRRKRLVSLTPEGLELCARLRRKLTLAKSYERESADA
jgi:DNA-binding MarR family transcriptional regulator